MRATWLVFVLLLGATNVAGEQVMLQLQNVSFDVCSASGEHLIGGVGVGSATLVASQVKVIQELLPTPEPHRPTVGYRPAPLSDYPHIRGFSIVVGVVLALVCLGLTSWLLVRNRGMGALVWFWGILLVFLVFDSWSAWFIRLITLTYVPNEDIAETADKLFTFMKYFGSTGITLIGLLIGCLDSWRKAARFWVVVGLASLVVSGLKAGIGRERPPEPGSQTEYPLCAMYVYGPAPSVTTSKYHAFPSGHTGSAFAELAVLGRFYPSGWPVFVVLAAGTALHRVHAGAHHLADTWVAIFLGYYVALWLLSQVRVMQLSDWLADRVTWWVARSWQGMTGRLVASWQRLQHGVLLGLERLLGQVTGGRRR